VRVVYQKKYKTVIDRLSLPALILTLGGIAVKTNSSSGSVEIPPGGKDCWFQIR
jgi:hypothetical protein